MESLEQKDEEDGNPEKFINKTPDFLKYDCLDLYSIVHVLWKYIISVNTEPGLLDTNKRLCGQF